MPLICYNGDFIEETTPVLTLQNRMFRFGEGLFETVLVQGSITRLKDLHVERLTNGMASLQMSTLDIGEITHNLSALVSRNATSHHIRARINVFSEGEKSSYTIETQSLDEDPTLLNERGWSVDIYPHFIKSLDSFANLKTASYLPFIMADKYAKEKSLDEAIILNTEGNICEATKMNVFLIKDGIVITPSLAQGCVNGVMRKHIIELVKQNGYSVEQKKIAPADLLAADEVFLTNAIKSIKWVVRFRDKTYSNQHVKNIYQIFWQDSHPRSHPS